MKDSIKNKAIVNVLWRFAERSGAKVVAFVVSIILARLLAPDDYGLIALITVFTSILQVFVDSGLGNALIQKKDADDVDFSSVFYFNIVFCVILYAILFALSPYIAAFYDNMELIPVVRVLGLTIVISGVKGVQQAYVSKNLMFKRFFFSTIGGTLGAAVVGITLAYLGYGVWALVAQQIFNTAVDTVILWMTVKWRPKKLFSFKRLISLLSYGWKFLVSSLINTIYNDIRQLIIGKVYSSSDLAYYNRGKQFPVLIIDNVNTSIDSVLLPVMSKTQNDRQHLKAMMRRSVMVSSYLIWPMMCGLAATGNNVVTLVLTEKWLPCIPFLYVFCFVYGMQPIHTANLNAIKAIGRSDLFLKMEIIKKAIGICIILITMNISVFAIGFGSVIYTIIASVINAFPNRKILEYSYLEQIKDILPSFLISVLMGIIVYCLPVSGLAIILQLVIQVITGSIVYVLLSLIFKLEIFGYLKQTLREFVRK